MRTAGQFYYKWVASILLFALVLAYAALPSYAGAKDSFYTRSNTQDRISISDHIANAGDSAFKIVILNDYDTGKTLGQVPTSFDYVYETDNGEIYVTNTTEQPAGSTRLYAN